MCCGDQLNPQPVAADQENDKSYRKVLRLAFDNTLKFGIKPKVKIAIYATPVACMLTSVVLTVLFSTYLASKLGIPEGVPVKGQENAGLWMFLMFCALFVFAFVGYVVGWFLNALGSLLLLRWPYSKVVEVFSKSQIPQNWCKVPEKY